MLLPVVTSDDRHRRATSITNRSREERVAAAQKRMMCQSHLYRAKQVARQVVDDLLKARAYIAETLIRTYRTSVIAGEDRPVGVYRVGIAQYGNTLRGRRGAFLPNPLLGEEGHEPLETMIIQELFVGIARELEAISPKLKQCVNYRLTVAVSDLEVKIVLHAIE